MTGVAPSVVRAYSVSRPGVFAQASDVLDVDGASLSARSAADYDGRADIAFIRLAAPADLGNTANAQVAAALPDGSDAVTDLVVPGFHGELAGNIAKRVAQGGGDDVRYDNSGGCMMVRFKNASCYAHSCQTGPGVSGAPVLKFQEEAGGVRAYLLGIHTGAGSAESACQGVADKKTAFLWSQAAVNLAEFPVGKLFENEDNANQRAWEREDGQDGEAWRGAGPGAGNACGLRGAGDQGRRGCVHAAQGAGAARAFLLDSCPLDPAIGKESILLPVLLAPLIKSAAASAIDAGYDYFLKVMSERQRQLTASSTFQATGSFYALEKPSAGQQGEFYRMPLKCLVLVREADTEPALSPDLREVWDINKEKINGALAIAKAGYALQRAPTFYAELKIRYLTLTVPAQALQDETGKPLLDRAGKAVVLPEPMDVPIEFEVKPARVFYGQSGAVRNPGDKKRLTLSVDLSAKAFENQKWTSTALLAKTFDLGMARRRFHPRIRAGREGRRGGADPGAGADEAARALRQGQCLCPCAGSGGHHGHRDPDGKRGRFRH